MKEEEKKQAEEGVLFDLIEMETLGAKKTAIYAKLLIEPSLAEDMQARSKRHEERKFALQSLLFKKTDKKQNQGSVSAMNSEGGEK